MSIRRGARVAWPLLLAGCRLGHAPVADVTLTLAGGGNPGQFEAHATQATCSRDLVGAGSWGVQLTDWTGPKEGLRSLQLLIPQDTVQDQFYLGMVFGDFFTGVAREIETRADSPRPKGHGRVTIVNHPPTGATFRVTGVTQDSVAVEAIVACHETQAKDSAT